MSEPQTPSEVLGTEAATINPRKDGLVEYTLGDLRFILRPVSAFAINNLLSGQIGRPESPRVEFKRKRKDGTSYNVVERNPDDPAYKRELTEWQAARSNRMMKYLIVRGVVNEPPAGYSGDVEPFIQTEDEKEVKYFWVCEQFTTVEGVEELSTAIMDLSMPTVEGIEDAEATFPDNGKRAE